MSDQKFRRTRFISPLQPQPSLVASCVSFLRLRIYGYGFSRELAQGTHQENLRLKGRNYETGSAC